MKVTKWWKNLAAAIVAAGIWVPNVGYALNIPLGDPSFEAYTPLPDGGIAYAKAAGGYTGAYRPTASPWVDDLDSPLSSGNVQYTQDDANSNWLYNTSYSELPGGSGHYRAVPRTGIQAMHGLAHYNAQKLTNTFQAGNTYTFSIWAQGDADAISADDKVYLYLFDGSVPFNESGPGTLALQGFNGGPGGTDFNKRADSNVSASLANWKQISLSYFVAPGSSAIGHPIGVAFYAYRDAAVDDASLTSSVPEPTTFALVGLGGVSLLGLRRRR